MQEHLEQVHTFNKVCATTAVRSSPAVETNSTCKDGRTREAGEDALSSDTFINKDLSMIIMNE